MRLRSIVASLAVLTVLATAAPAHADIGVHCAGWKQTSVQGVQANSCYLRSMYWTVRGRGKAYYDGPRALSYMAVAVQLQKSLNGVNGWMTEKSAVCGWLGDDVHNEVPGNICNTGYINVDAGYIYRTRMLVSVHYVGGGSSTSEFVYSDITT